MKNFRQISAGYVLIAAVALAIAGGARAAAECYSVGYAHLDVSWRWSVNEGINKMRNTTLKQMNNMEKYPQFRFSFDSPLMYEWMEIYYPDLFRQIKTRIGEGRWEPISGMWADPMVELVDGEEFVRQWLIGKRYIKDKFGYEIKIGSDLDQYGAWPGGNLPQIAKKSGIQYYTFVRGLKGTDGKFFWWTGNDGSKIFSHDTDYWFNCPEGMCGCSNTEPGLKYYGAGDGGGGPFLEQAALCAGDARCGTLAEFFNDAAARKLPESTSLTAEGYTLSSNGIKATGILAHRPFLKWFNRKCAVKLMEAEKFSTFALSLRFKLTQAKLDSFLGGCLSGELGVFNYPQQDINRALKKYLQWQHHDSLPGNFTWDGVKIARNELETVYNTFDTVLDSALLTVGSHVNTEGEGTPVLVFNSLSWPRSGVVELNLGRVGNPEGADVTDADGKIVPTQVSTDGKKKIVFLAKDIPATGYKLFRIIPTDKSSRPDTGAKALRADDAGLVFENEFFILELDRKTGFWKRVYDKANKREVLDGGGNILGSSKNDAWPYGEGFDEWGTDLGDADGISVVESGPARVKIRVRHGVVSQDTILYAGVNRIDCFVWSDNYLDGGPAYLRVVFHLNVADGIYTTEGPYGYAESPDKSTNLEKPTLSWQDLSGGGYGASLINDSKYGGDRDGKSIKLSLISHAEFDGQRMLYSLYPHGGGWREARVPSAGYAVNYPLIVRREENHKGEMPASYSFVEASPANAIVSVVKKHEDSGDAIVRVYETTGAKGPAKLTFSGGALGAREIDMIEWNETGRDLKITDDKTVNFDLNPYEIKTLRVKLPPYFGNKVFIERPRKLILVAGASSGFSVRLNNARANAENVKVGVAFPADSGIGPQSVTASIESGESKEITLKTGSPARAAAGEATLEVAYGKIRETEKIPFEVIPSVPKLGDGEVVLYNVWEAEALSHKTGSRVMDGDAGNAMAWLGEAGKDNANDHLMFGPYESLPEGKYLVSFRLKAGEKVKEDVATVDVNIFPKGVPSLAQSKVKKSIAGADFAEAGAYQEFPLMLKQPADNVDEFRLFWTGKTSLWIDRVAVFRVIEK